MKKLITLFFITTILFSSYSCDSGSSSSKQCKATTKKGVRCKRNAEQGSIYCWQHK